MSSGELTEWAAYEQAYGPLLVHDRVDIGFAQVCTVLAHLLGKKSRHTIKDFLPAWWREALNKSERDDNTIRKNFEALMRTAENAHN